MKKALQKNKQLEQLLSPFSVILRVIVPLRRHYIELAKLETFSATSKTVNIKTFTRQNTMFSLLMTANNLSLLSCLARAKQGWTFPGTFSMFKEKEDIEMYTTEYTHS